MQFFSALYFKSYHFIQTMSSPSLISLALSVEYDANENREKKWLHEILGARSVS